MSAMCLRPLARRFPRGMQRHVPNQVCWYHSSKTIAQQQQSKNDTTTTGAYFAHKTVMIPHDKKRQRYGEDAAAANHELLVVADGVGGWITEGVNPAVFARTLVQTILEAAPFSESLKELVHQSNLQTASKHLGSCTCTCLKLVPDSRPIQCETLNVGDSGYAIFRLVEDKWTLQYASQVGQKDFNFPDQLGGIRFGDDARVVGINETHTLEVNDVVVVYTDGVSDNLSPDLFPAYLDANITSTTEEDMMAGLRGAADTIAKTAYFLGKNKTFLSPFAQGARKAGWGSDYIGGKHDDITVMVAKVRSGARPTEIDKTASMMHVGGVDPPPSKQ